jgi:hypothetical protein
LSLYDDRLLLEMDMGRRILILIFILCSLQSAQAFADDSDVGVTQSSEAFLPKPFVNSVLFGTGAGLLLGLVLGGGMPGIFRGASLRRNSFGLVCEF